MEAGALSGSLGLDAGQVMQQMRHLEQREQIAHVSQQFEGVLIRQFLKDAMKPLIKGYLGDESSGNEIYQHFVLDSLADGIVKGGGIGVSNIMQMQLQGVIAKPSSNS